MTANEEIGRIAAVLHNECVMVPKPYRPEGSAHRTYAHHEEAAVLYDAGLRVRQDTPGLREALANAEAAISKYSDIGRRVGGTSIDPDERSGVAAYAYRLSDELAKVWLEWDDNRRALARQDTETRPATEDER